MLAYLVMMAPRLAELRRVLKPTGSIYLHCDPTASHYLKMLMDAVFGQGNFLNEISWRRSQTRSSISKIYKRAHDILLFFSRSDSYTFDMQYKSLSETSLKIYSKLDDRGRYRLVPLVVSGRRNGETGLPWRGIDPNKSGKSGSHWITIPSKLDEYEKKGLVVWPQKTGGLPQLKYYLDDNKGVPVTDFWDDIDLISSSSAESLGYPTQKPEALLERIIKASSNEGDLVLDPFCGCGTTIAAAQKLKRAWIGIDITHLAITLMKKRLLDTFGTEAKFKVLGEPTSLPDAAALAESDPYQFQYWALGLVGARPEEEKRGADKGIDGKIIFQGDAPGVFETVILSVKAGQHIPANAVRDLRGVLDGEKAAIGILISMQDPTGPMKQEAVTAGFFESKTWGKRYPKVQLLTIADLLGGKGIEMPPIKQVEATFKKAEKFKGEKGQQFTFPEGEKK